MGKKQLSGGPYWSKAWIQKLWEFTNQKFVDFDTGAVDFKALGEEEYNFRKAMFFRNFKNSERAKEAFEEADKDYKKNVENGKKGGRPPNDKPSEEKETSKPAEKHVVVNKDVFGDFENVYLSQDEHNEFIKKVGNINEAAKIIDQLSAALADGKEKSTNHYATLLRWLNYRNDKKENAPKSFEEHERERSSKLVMSFLAKTGGPIDDDTGPY